MKPALRTITITLVCLFLIVIQVGFVRAASPTRDPVCMDSIISCDFSQRPLTSIIFGNNSNTKKGNTNYAVNSIIHNHLLPFIYSLLGAAAVIMLILAGIRYITSAGSPDATKKARQSIINVMLGIALLTASYAVISLILGTLQFIASKAT